MQDPSHYSLHYFRSDFSCVLRWYKLTAAAAVLVLYYLGYSTLCRTSIPRTKDDLHKICREKIIFLSEKDTNFNPYYSWLEITKNVTGNQVVNVLYKLNLSVKNN